MLSASRADSSNLDDHGIRYHPLTGDDRSAGECFDAVTCEHNDLPERVRVRDYDYAKPKLEVAGTAPVSQSGEGEVNSHGARFFTPKRGDRLAEVRAEELLTVQTVFAAEGSALYLRAGYTFKLEDHPHRAFNRAYLATTVRHFANQAARSPDVKRHVRLAFDDVYRVEVGAIRSDVQFRPAQATPWPRVYGSEYFSSSGGLSSGARRDPSDLNRDHRPVSPARLVAWLRSFADCLSQPGAVVLPHAGHVENEGCSPDSRRTLHFGSGGAIPPKRFRRSALMSAGSCSWGRLPSVRTVVFIWWM